MWRRNQQVGQRLPFLLYETIMKRLWIGLLLLLLVFVFWFRESFTTYEEALKDVGQTAGYISLEPVCPEGSALDTAKTICKFSDATKADVAPTCSSDTLEFVGGTCKPKATPTGTSADTNAAPVSEPTTTPTTTTTTPTTTTPTTTTPTTTTTTGMGGSTSTTASTPIPSTQGQSIFGPAFAGMGEVKPGASSVDSSTSTQYPQLLGGGVSGTKSKEKDAGLLWGAPSPASLGATEESKFLPYSRVPGDMDVIPDPYRVSNTYSSSSYSSKTEPVPFLTDFSAFLR